MIIPILPARRTARGKSALTTTDTGIYKTQQLKSVSYNDGVTSSLGYTYKRSGALAGVTDATGSRAFNYHANGRLDSETLSAFFGSRSINQTYSGAMSTGFEVKQGSSVESGMLATFNSSTGRVTSLDGLGSLPTFTPGYLSGSDWVESWTSGSYSRSQNLAPARDIVKTATASWGGTIMAGFDSTFNSRGLRWTTIHSGVMTSAGTTTLEYNSRYELTSSDESNGTDKDFTWDYDLIGKRTTASEAGLATAYSPTASASQDVNKYDSISGKNVESGLNYDIDGNLTRDGNWDYSYDAENRLISMSNRHVTQTLQFTYDYIGRRVRKTVTGVGASTTTYVWNGWKLIEELDAGSGLIRGYVWGADFSNAAGSAGGAGGLLAVNYYGNNYYPAYDNHGNIVGYINHAGGVSATYEYNAFGEILSASGSSDHFTLGYASQITDRETGLIYYGLRFYNHRHGRFINRDPLGEDGGLNLYSFVGNGAGNAWDVLGLTEVLPPVVFTYGGCRESVEILGDMEYLVIDCGDSGVQMIPIRSVEPLDIDIDDVPAPIEPINVEFGPIEAVKLPCSLIAEALIPNMAFDNQSGEAKKGSIDRLKGDLSTLAKSGGALGAALVLGYARSEREIIWSEEGAAGGRLRANSAAQLRLNSSDGEWGPSASPDSPGSSAIVLGHELGHAVIGINSNMYPYIHDKSIQMLATETANVLSVENPLRRSLGKESRVSYLGLTPDIMSTVVEDPGLLEHAWLAVDKVQNFINKERAAYGCE